ncbi:MAG: NAD-dependent epimerase/dehydratase family protein [Bacteroidota bacterium]
MILISGSTGFLGAHVACHLLQHQRKIKLIKRKTASLAEFDKIFNYHFKHFDTKAKDALYATIVWADADILDMPLLEQAFNEVTEVYHCAAMVSFDQADKEKMMKTNVEGTANMVNLALMYSVKKFCYISSIAAIGRSIDGATIDENCKWENNKLNSNYAISKYKAEMEVWRGKEEGLNICIVNPGVILGYGDFTKGSINLFQSVYKGMPLYTQGVNGYVDVEDIAKVCYTLMEQNIFGSRYILCSESVSIKHLFDMMAENFGVKKPAILVKPWMGEIAWRLFALVRMTGISKFNLTKETARASQKKYYYNNTKIRAAIDFNFEKVEQTVRQVCTLYLNDLENG